MRILLLLLCLASPAVAQTPLSGEAFEDLVAGKTLTFSANDAPYGVEYYAPNRRVVWSFGESECTNGEWYEEIRDGEPAICFIYENNDTPQCWRVFDVDGKIRVTYLNRPGTTILFESTQAEPLICGGVGA